jgi:hypothetical protein
VQLENQLEESIFKCGLLKIPSISISYHAVDFAVPIEAFFRDRDVLDISEPVSPHSEPAIGHSCINGSAAIQDTTISKPTPDWELPAQSAAYLSWIN